MHARRWLAVLLVVLGALPALLAMSLLWFAISDRVEEWRRRSAPSGTTTVTSRTSVVVIGVPGAGSRAVEPWLIGLVAAAMAGACFAGGWVLWRGDSERAESGS